MQTHNIILIGPSGSGKTATAPILSEILGMRSCDTDELISVVCGIDGRDIIIDRGISSFRSVEEFVVQAALFTGGRVVATGAGAWTIPAVRAAARQNGISVLLQVPRDELVRRLQHSDRVIVKMHGAEDVVDLQLAERSREYGLADIAIDCAGLSIEQVARRVRAAVEEYRRQSGNDYHPSEKDNEWR